MSPTHTWMAIAWGLCASTSTLAQTSDLALTVGLKAWHVEWSSFGYAIDSGSNTILVQAAARDKTLFLPVASLRYRNVIASVSGYRGTEMEFLNGERAKRHELDANVGYFVLPGVAATVGYKRFELSGAAGSKSAVRGPVFGLSLTAPVGHDVSVYGSFGHSRMRPSDDSIIRFKTRYSLTDLGLAYTLPAAGLARAFTLTLGYRTQSIKAREALGTQTAADSAEGIALGGFVTF